MECNVTFIKRKQRSGAFTLVDILVATVVGSLVLLAFAKLTAYTGRSFAALTNYVDLDRHSRDALDQMVSKIRQATELTSYSSNRLQFDYQKTNTLIYAYSPSAKTLTETFAGASKVLLTGCDQLNFYMFQRNTAGGTYDQFPATMTNNAAKLIQVSWVCSRTVLGTRINTESVQSAKIVIRNQ
jgi:Tfp pilus assembly protein PilW